ncbi:MAG TPA: hypothetical protein GX506_10890 [Firmicutes bacterium]|nr:hypothetical protein [Bacillota bacterium]
MKIARIEAIIVRMPLRKAFNINLASVTYKDHVVVRVFTDDGFVGIGEAAPLPQFSGEAGDAMVSIIKENLAPAVVGLDPFDIEKIVSAMDGAIAGHNLAKSAIDFAVYDLMGKSIGKPVAKLLGGCVRETVPLCWAVGIGKPDDVIAEALDKVKEGYRCLKLKIGLNPKEDIERVRLVREAVGDEIKLRVDANQGYRPDTAIPTLRKMERYELQYAEQPVPKWDLDGMARVAASVGVPIMADESVFNLNDAVEIVRRRAASVINIKVGKLGGLYKSKKVAAIAEAADIACMVGSMLEAGIGTVAAAHFAASTQNVGYECELIGSLMYDRDIIADELDIEGGVFRIPQSAGLGVGVAHEPLGS